MKICDAHIHVGQFYNIHTSPAQLLRFFDGVGVERYAVSSTSICEGNYRKVLYELSRLDEISGNRMYPVLWILPQMFYDGGMDFFLTSGLAWKCLKIHPQLNPDAWKPRGKNMHKLLEVAETINLPILIHTGDFEFCHAGLYKDLAKKNPNITFILAHGRPIDETISVMKACDNVYTDTAFMPAENVAMLCGAGLSERVLWGTDYPIPKYYYRGKPMRKYYSNLLDSLKKMVSESDFNHITHENFLSVFANK